MITTRQARHICKLARELAAAEVAYSWKGTEPPEVITIIEKDLEIAKLKFAQYIASLQEEKVP